MTKRAVAEAPLRPALLIDTYSLVFRAHHALPPMNTQAGEPTSALYGFSALLLKLLKEQQPSALAFALDAPKRTFRHEQYADYKGTRDAVPSLLLPQLRRLPSLLEALQVPVVCVPGYEADDVLATLARGLSQAGSNVLIVTGDRDLLQLVDERARVLFVGARGQKPTLFERAQVVERFQVEPAQLPSWAALVGDTSDNIVGVPGIGPSTAAKLIREFGDVAALLAQLEQIKPERTREALRQHADRVVQNEALTRLRRDVPLPPGAFAAPFVGEGFRRLAAEFEALEFRSLLPRLAALRDVAGVAFT